MRCFCPTILGPVSRSLVSIRHFPTGLDSVVPHQSLSNFGDVIVWGETVTQSEIICDLS